MQGPQLLDNEPFLVLGPLSDKTLFCQGCCAESQLPRPFHPTFLYLSKSLQNHRLQTQGNETEVAAFV